MVFKGLFVANNQSAAFENVAFGHSHTDYIIVEYSIDGGSYQNLIQFYSINTSGIYNKSLAEDTNYDGIGDGTVLTGDFTVFTKSIPETGNSLSLRIRCSTNGSNEEFAFDYLQIFGDSCVPPIITTNPVNRYICNGNDTSLK